MKIVKNDFQNITTFDFTIEICNLNFLFYRLLINFYITNNIQLTGIELKVYLKRS